MSGKSGRLRLLCRKTELCRFHLKGACKRGTACDFAHKEEDMRVKPDLQRTKPCPAILDGGECKDPDCPFAHRSGELRKFKPQLTAASFAGADGAAEQQGRGSIGKPAPDSQASTEDGTESSSGSQPEESSDFMGILNNDKLLFQPEAGGLSRQTTAFSDGGWTRQTSGFSDGGLMSRQISSESETPLRPENKKHKTRLCSFHMNGRCRKDNCTFAHGTSELALPPGSSARSATKTSTMSTESSQTETPPPSWPSETTSEDGTYNSGQPPPSSCGDDQEWPMNMKSKVHPEEEMDPWQSCPDEAEERLVVINTFLTILGSDRPKVFRRTRSAPSLCQ